MADHVNSGDPALQHRTFSNANMQGYGSYQYPPAGESQYDAEGWSAIDPSLALNNASDASSSVPLSAHAWHNSPTGASVHPPPNQAFSHHASGYYNGVYTHSASPFQGVENFQPPPNYGAVFSHPQLDPSLGYSTSTPPTTASITRPGQSNSNSLNAPSKVQAIQANPSQASYPAHTHSATRPSSVQSFAAKPLAAIPSGPAQGSRSSPVVQSAHPAAKLTPILPPFKQDGSFYSMELQALVGATGSRRLHEFVTIGDQPQDIPISRSAIPNYNPRKSRNEIISFANGDKKILSKLAKQSKKTKVVVPKSVRARDTTLPRLVSDVKSPVSVSSSESESSEDDSDYDSSGDELHIVEEPPLPPTRPVTAKDAMRYDTIKAVWLPRSRPTQGVQIQTALGAFWNVAKIVRDRWKSDTEDVKKAEEAKKHSEVPFLKERVALQRETMETVLKAAAEHGHPEIISRFSENLHFLACCASFLIDRNREGDWNGVLARNALDILSRCSTLTPEKLDKTNLAKVLRVYAKKGDEKTQSLIKKINEAAGTPTKSKADSPAKTNPSGALKREPEFKREGSAKLDLSKKVLPEQVAGVKRARIGDGAGQPAKKPTSGTASMTTAKTTTSSGIKRPGSAPAATSSPASTSAAPKAKPVTAKPSGFFSSLQSASKKPGTSNAEQAAVKKDGAAGNANPIRRATSSAPSTAPAKSTFSFMETMANLTKVKEPEKKEKVEETKKEESEEEKIRRLRKESRRHLRVTWKPDTDLVQVKLFTHDPSEDLGHDANMVLDAVGAGEGATLKQHKDMMDIDEDEDGVSEEKMLRPFHTPSKVDFSAVEKDALDNNYLPYGGGKKRPYSPEADLQKEREKNALMEIYVNFSDIPPCPNEPADPYNGEYNETRDLGAVPQYVADRSARFLPSTSLWQAGTNGAVTDVSAILAGLGIPAATSQPATLSQPAAPSQPATLQQAPAQSSTTTLEAIFKQFGAQQPAALPVSAPTLTSSWANTLPPAQTSDVTDIKDILARLEATKTKGSGVDQGQVAIHATPHTSFGTFPSIPVTNVAPSTDLSSILANLGVPAPPPMPDFLATSYNQQNPNVQWPSESSVAQTQAQTPALDLQALGLGGLSSLLGGQITLPPTGPAAQQAQWNSSDRVIVPSGPSALQGLDYDDDEDDTRPGNESSESGQSGGRRKKKKNRNKGKKKWSWQD